MRGDKMKKKFIIVIVLLLVGIIVLGWQVISHNIAKRANQVVVTNVDLSSIQDGTYVGEYAITPVKVIVEVAVKESQIYDIKILEHENGLGKKAETIIDKIIEVQNLTVDSITGATVSSKTILKAVENALSK